MVKKPLVQHAGFGIIYFQSGAGIDFSYHKIRPFSQPNRTNISGFNVNRDYYETNQVFAIYYQGNMVGGCPRTGK